MYKYSFLTISGYSPVGDITVIALCTIMCILLWQTLIHKTERFIKTFIILVLTAFSAVTNILYETSIRFDNIRVTQAYVFRTLHYILLIGILYMYVIYLYEPLWISEKVKKRYNVFSLTGVGCAIIFDLYASHAGFGFRITGEQGVSQGFNIYHLVAVLFMLTILFLVIKYRSRIIRQIFYCLLGINLVSVLVLVIQFTHNQNSFTDVAYFFPVIGIIFLFHSNPYDINTGAIEGKYLSSELKDCFDSKKNLLIISCKMLDFTKLVNENNDLRLEFYRFFRQNIRRGVLYRFANDRLVLTIRQNSDTDYAKVLDKMISDFTTSYEKFHIDYKIIVMDTTPLVEDIRDYEKIITSIEGTMSYNCIHTVGKKDITQYYDNVYILSELEDIVRKKDLNDPRILVYCQPVYNLTTGCYDTAEALMRLTLEKITTVFPDKFISLAEQHGLIHTMSLIMLNKTCAAIRDYMEKGFELRRISVNFSTVDLRYDSFCSEVRQIIDRHGIPYDKIAVEITESRNDADFTLMKQRVEELKKLGIKFYLDDFGTGYSNFERIMEIPFDIIKFDRTMLIEAVKNHSSRFMVSTFANMFNSLQYSVLFEGVETSDDEKECVDMKAKYLQGYKYSHPVPIEELWDKIQSITAEIAV